MSKLKWHKNCGGTVLYKEGPKGCRFERAGECQTCGAFPLNQEEILFEIDKDQVERFFEPCETCGLGESQWNIVSKNDIKEVLQKEFKF